jgi:hypothetical protein
VYFEEFGSYQGEWILVTEKDDTFYIYKDWYGSCSGCDALEAFEADKSNYEWDYELTLEDKKEFAENYKPFAEIPSDIMRAMVEADTLRQAMPANLKLELSKDYDDMPEDEAWDIVTNGIKAGITK